VESVKGLKSNTYHFLQGGGEMGRLTRDYDWSSTKIGSPDKWPQSLRTTVATILSSRFPMFLWWGDDMIQFYNDAYRPSLGNNGKHPLALGQSAKDCWPEIWDIIYPLIRQVQTTGEGTWSEDQLIPIYRNGKIEDVYWTFGYSPIRGESDKIEGVLVVCTETTGKIENLRRLESANQRFRDTVLQAPVAIAVFRGPDFVAETANNAYLPLVAKSSDEFVGKPLFESLPETKDILKPILNEVVRTGIPFHANEFEIVLHRHGRDEICYFNLVYEPLRENDGSINGFIAVAHEVTDQVMARKKIEESEERFRIMAEGTDLFIAVGDETSNAVYFNKAWIQLTGRSMEDLLQFGWLDLVHLDDREGYLNIYLSAFKERKPFASELRILNRNGEYRWLLASGPPRFHPDGSFAGYISSCIDITERKQAETAMQQSEQQVRSVVESAPFPIGVYVGREMRIMLANQAILEVFGKGNDVIGKLYSHVLPELDNQEIFTQLDNVYTTGIPFHNRNQRVDIMKKSGRMQTYYFNYSFTPLYDATGNIYGVMNTAADVTDLHMAKQIVEENEKSFRNTILKAPVAMCTFKGPDHMVEIANDRMIELWGKSAPEVLNKPMSDALTEAREQGFEHWLDVVYNSGETLVAEGVPVTLPRDGKIEIVYVNFVFSAARAADGSISGILAVAVDVTSEVLARQKIEDVVAERTAELAEANLRLQQSNASLEQFAYIASHDLQEPVRKVSTFAQMLERSLGDIDDRSKSYLGKINNSASRMLTLIRDVLAYSQISQDKEVFKPVNLQQVVDGISSDFELLIEQKEAVIECVNLPVIEAIPLQMSQLFGNLISNALKFSRKDIPPVIHISATLLSDEEVRSYLIPVPEIRYYNIECRDNGIGFLQEYAEQIFNIFQRLHGRTDYAGNGIGLAMCKKIAQNHRGDIFATSCANSGAQFNIILPAKHPKGELIRSF
jgi:PAS domain S-box-containing protein